MKLANRCCSAVCCTRPSDREKTCLWTWLMQSNMSTKSRVATCALSAVVMIVYVCLGSALFNAVEQKDGEGHGNKNTELINKLIKNLDSLRNFSSTSVDRNFNDEEYSSLLKDANNTALQLLRNEQLSNLQWNFYTGIHFCLTAITTIGYGYITPVTQLGRGLCIPYVVIGIPINLYFSSKLAYFLTQWVTKLYIFLAKFTNVLVCKKRSQGELSPRNVHKVDSIGEFLRDADLQDDLLGTSGSIKYADDTFNSYNETLSPQSEVGILQDPQRSGRTNDTKSVSKTSCPIKSAGNTSNETLHKAPHSDDDKTLIPVWFMFLLLIAFCSLVSLIVYLEEGGNWSFLDSFYYVIITFTTVGFGDLPYKSSRDYTTYETIWWKMIYTYALMEIGLVIMTASITVCADRFRQSVIRAKTALHSKHVAGNSGANCNISVIHLTNQLRTRDIAQGPGTS